MLSVVLPAYNEERRIESALDRIGTYLRGREHEIVVVDDGSRDATRGIAERLARSDAAVRIVSYGGNRGKGAAVRAGMLEARGDWILVSDVDLSSPIEELETLEAHRAGADVVVGSRALPGSRLEVRQPARRERLGRAFNCAVRLVGVYGVRDTQCGFKLWSRGAAQKVFRRLSIEGFSFDVESLWLARRFGFRVREVPVIWRHDERSTVRVARDGMRMARDLLRVLFRRSLRWPD